MQFINECGELETAKPGDRVEALVVAELGAEGARLVSILSFLAIFFMFTG